MRPGHLLIQESLDSDVANMVTSNYSCVEVNGLCVSEATSTTITAAGCLSPDTVIYAQEVPTTRDSDWGNNTLTALSLWAPMIRLVRREDPHTVIATPTQTPTLPPSTPLPDPLPPPRGLSTGAKAGIGVAAGVVLLSAIGSAIWLFLRRRRHARLAAQQTAQNETSQVELPDHRTDRPELEGNDARHELPSPKGISEVASGEQDGAGPNSLPPVGVLVELE